MLEDEQISESELRDITRMLEEAMTGRMVLANIVSFGCRSRCSWLPAPRLLHSASMSRG